MHELTMESAVGRGNLELVKWLRRAGCPMEVGAVCAEAERRGHSQAPQECRSLLAGHDGPGPQRARAGLGQDGAGAALQCVGGPGSAGGPPP